MASIEIPSTEALFDDIGPAYELAFSGLEPQQASIQWVLAELKGAPDRSEGAKVVDIGCGTGRPVCEAFAIDGYDVLGVDLSTAMVEAAKKNVPTAKFEKRDMREFLQSAIPESFDVATVYFSMLSGVTQDEIRSSINDIARLLKSGGLFVFATVPVDGNCVQMTWMGRPVNVSSLSAEDAVAHIQKVGFEIVHHQITQFLPKGAEAGICKADEVWEEPHLFVYARKPRS